MAYTVKQLAKIAGGSVRTLHWYDKIGLLKPAYIGSNGYRYYEEKQLTLLKQILFFRELGFKLNEIQGLLDQNNISKLNTLILHKQSLELEINKKKVLINNINEVIETIQINNETPISIEYLQNSLNNNHETACTTKNNQTKHFNYDAKQWDDLKSKSHNIHLALVEAIEKNHPPESPSTQDIIHQHYLLQGRFYDLTKDSYIELTDLYQNHPDFKNFFMAYHPELITYITAAIKYYASTTLTESKSSETI